MSFDSVVYDYIPGTRLPVAALLRPFASLLSYANNTKHLHEGGDRSVDTRPSQKTIKFMLGAWDRFYRAYTIVDLSGHQSPNCQSGPSGNDDQHETEIEGGEEDDEPEISGSSAEPTAEQPVMLPDSIQAVTHELDMDGMSLREMVDPTDMVPSDEERVIAGPKEDIGEVGESETDEGDFRKPQHMNMGSCDPPPAMENLSQRYDGIIPGSEGSGPEIDEVRFSWASVPPCTPVKTQITDNNESAIQAFALEYNTPPSPVIVTITPSEGYPTVVIPHGRESGQWF